MSCVETVCHERQNITLKTVLNKLLFLWLVLNHKNFEKVHLLSILCAETVKICATASGRKWIFFMLKQMCGCFWKHVCFLKNMRLLLKDIRKNVRHIFLRKNVQLPFLEILKKYFEVKYHDTDLLI